MEVRVIKTAHEYGGALAEAEELATLDPKSGTAEADKLELLTLLIQEYEKEHFPTELPDPVEAIKFRVEQQGLSNRDLIPFIGSRSKVSEVLSGKRQLTLPMIRALHEGLGIPAEALIREPIENLPSDFDWDKFPTKEMIKRRWIRAKRLNFDRPEQLVRNFLTPLRERRLSAALFKRTIHQRSGRKMDTHALLAWILRIQILGQELILPAKFKEDTVTLQFMQEVTHLSWSEHGPLLAQEFLANHGLALVIESYLPGTYLDGASMRGNDGRPIIGLTLRHDRLDNFWFTLLHELAHLSLHLSSEVKLVFVDDLDIQNTNDEQEKEADKLGGEALVPRSTWRNSRAYQQRTPEAIAELAAKLKLHPAIIAGKIRHDAHNYRILNQMVGHGEVRQSFADQRWD